MGHKVTYMGLKVTYMGLRLSHMGPLLTSSKEALIGEEWNTKDSEKGQKTQKMWVGQSPDGKSFWWKEDQQWKHRSALRALKNSNWSDHSSVNLQFGNSLRQYYILVFLMYQNCSKIKVLLYNMQVEKISHQAKLPPSLISCEITIGLVIISSEICYYCLWNRPQ